jgi:hypothetical protein
LRSSVARGLAGIAVLTAVVIVMVATQQIILAAAPQGAGGHHTRLRQVVRAAPLNENVFK